MYIFAMDCFKFYVHFTRKLVAKLTSDYWNIIMGQSVFQKPDSIELANRLEQPTGAEATDIKVVFQYLLV
jgi:hypothetical protein